MVILSTVDRKNRIGTSINSIETLKIWEQRTTKRHIAYQLVGSCESPHQHAICAIGISKHHGLYQHFSIGEDNITIVVKERWNFQFMELRNNE